MKGGEICFPRRPSGLKLERRIYVAAHAVTGLAEVIAKAMRPDVQTETVWNHLRAALDLSCWTEDLPLDHWRYLDEAVQKRSTIALLRYAIDAASWALAEWYNLGCPDSREGWYAARERRGDFGDPD